MFTIMLSMYNNVKLNIEDTVICYKNYNLFFTVAFEGFVFNFNLCIYDCIFLDLNEKDGSSKLKVIAATNKPDFIDLILRGHFETEIAIGMPNEDARLK